MQSCDFCNASDAYDDITIKELELEAPDRNDSTMIMICSVCLDELKDSNHIIPILDKEENQPDWLYLRYNKSTLEIKTYESIASLNDDKPANVNETYLYGYWKNRSKIPLQLIQSLTGENNYGSSNKETVISKDWSSSTHILVGFRRDGPENKKFDYFEISPVMSKYTRNSHRITDSHQVWNAVEKILAKHRPNLPYIVTDSSCDVVHYSYPLENPHIEWFESISELEKSRWNAANRNELDVENVMWQGTTDLFSSYINNQIALRNNLDKKINTFKEMFLK